MKIEVITVGRPAALLADAIAEFESRAARYWQVRFTEVRAAKGGKNRSDAVVRETEGQRLLERVPAGSQVVALTREGGDAWSSERFARHLQDLSVHGGPDQAFLIGGAFGLWEEILRQADSRMRLSAFSLSHDIARLVLAEQLYRAGTIIRGEPYHKGSSG